MGRGPESVVTEENMPKGHPGDANSPVVKKNIQTKDLS